VNSKELDQVLLWGTTTALLAVTMVGGAIMWKNAAVPASPGFVTTQMETLTAQGVYAEARQFFLDSNWEEAQTKAKVALALERAQPNARLQADLQKILAISMMRSGDFAEAARYWEMVARRSGQLQDRQMLAECQRAASQAIRDRALQQLKLAQDLTQGGQTQRAVAEANQALRALEGLGSDRGTLQVAQLVVVNAAIRQGNYGLARERMLAARKLGPLRPEQETVFKNLRPTSTARISASVSAPQIPVVVPSLGTGPNYPQRSGDGLPRQPVAPSLSEAPQQTTLPDDPNQPPAGQPGRPTTKVELPRLQLPEGNDKLPGYSGGRSDGRLPSYQDQSGSALPTYSNKTRPRDRLPGY
jgi:hypothetical protein